MNNTKGAHELQKENSRDEQGVWKDKAPDRSGADPRHHYCATLITKKSTAVQAPRSEHVGLGESELLYEWQDECQVACINKHTCINKSESKSMY